MEKIIKILSQLRHLGVRHLTCGMVSKIGKCVCTVLALTDDLWSGGCYSKFVFGVCKPKIKSDNAQIC